MFGPNIYRIEGRKIIEVKKLEIIVVRKSIPNLLSIPTLQNVKKRPEKQDVSAPPRIVYPI